MKRITRRRAIIAAAVVAAALVAVSVTQLVLAETPSTESVLTKAMSGLAGKGVPVKSWALSGNTLGITLQSPTDADVATADDAINVNLAEREAFLAKARGVAVAAVQLRLVNTAGKVMFSADLPINQQLDPSWAAKPAQDEATAAAAVRAALGSAGKFPGLAIDTVEVTTDTDARQLNIAVTAPDVTSANIATGPFMTSVHAAVDSLNATKGTQIALTRVKIVDESGAPLLNWIYDAQRSTQDWWQAPGMTKEWFETPGTTATPDTNSAQ